MMSIVFCKFFSLSSDHRISALPSKVNEITGTIAAEAENGGVYQENGSSSGSFFGGYGTTSQLKDLQC